MQANQFSDFFTQRSAYPPVITGGFTSLDGGEDDQDMINDAEADLPDDLAGLSLGIDYENAKGDVSRRLIRIAKASKQTFRAYCFLREALRTFRYDRIRAIFDADGLVIEKDQFFKHFMIVNGVHMASAAKKDPAQWAYLETRSRFRDDLNILTALARSDGALHRKEGEAILVYIIQQAENDGLFLDDTYVGYLECLILNLHPNADAVLDSIQTIRHLPERRRRRLFQAAGKIMNADRVQDAAEFDFMVQLEQAWFSG